MHQTLPELRRPRYFSLHLRPLRAPCGFVEALVGVGEDLTALVEAEHSLRASEARLEMALWGSKAAFWTISVREDSAAMSPSFFKFTGIEAAEWAADKHPWNSRMHPEDGPSARRIYEDYVAGRIDFYEFEYRLRTPVGWIWLHDRGRVTERDVDGRPLKIAGTTLTRNRGPRSPLGANNYFVCRKATWSRRSTT